MYLLFDVDGTLTLPRKKIEKKMEKLLVSLKHQGHTISCVSGSDLPKLKEQLGDSLDCFDYIFTENGLVSYTRTSKDVPFHKQSFLNCIGEEKYQVLINTILECLSKINLPVKRSNFIELRDGMINVSPIGRNCSQKEREQFEEYDKLHCIRKKLSIVLKEKMEETVSSMTLLKYSIGGQISIDIFPEGWDKTYCLQFIPETETISFYGDRIFPGGNDYEIACHPRVKPFKVDNCQETYDLLLKLLEGSKDIRE